MTKVQLSELTEKDVENLMDNSKVWGKTINSISEQTSLVLDDFISALKGLGQYSISDSSDYNNCLPVENSYYFLDSLEDACGYNAGALSDDQIDKASKLVKDYENADWTDDDQREQLEDAMDNLANKYADILLKAMVAEYDFIYDNDYVKEYMQEELTNMYPEGALYNREDNSIYHMVKDQGENNEC